MLVHQYKGTMGVGSVDKMDRDTNANFSIDAKQSAPELPGGIDERLYEPDVRHALIANHNVVAGGPMPWPEGDAILKTADALIAAQKDRLAADLEAQRKQIKDGAEANIKKLAAENEAYRKKIEVAGKARAEEMRATHGNVKAEEG